MHSIISLHTVMTGAFVKGISSSLSNRSSEVSIVIVPVFQEVRTAAVTATACVFVCQRVCTPLCASARARMCVVMSVGACVRDSSALGK